MGLLDREDQQPWDLPKVKELDWRELELMIGAALESKGYQAEVTPPVKDGGIDVDAGKIDLLRSILFRPKLLPRRKQLIIDAKQWSDPVDASPVEKIADRADKRGCTGVIASPSGFWESAERVAKQRGVKLYDGDRIVKLFNKTNVELSDID